MTHPAAKFAFQISRFSGEIWGMPSQKWIKS